jgi:serine/alanine adding enzyme
MKKYTSSIDNINIDAWADFVQQHPEGNIFQSPIMYRLYEQSENYKPVAIIQTDEQNNITGSFLVSLFSEKKGLVGKLMRRAMTVGCPLVKDEQDIIGILKETHTLTRSHSLYLKISNILDKRYLMPKLEKIGYIFEPHLNFLINLKQPEEVLWKNLHETRRKQIKRAYNRGIRVEVTRTVPDIGPYYDILLHTYQRAGLPIDHPSLFQQALTLLAPKNNLVFISAYMEDKLIAHRMVLSFKNYLYDWYAGNLTDFQHVYPNDVLVWETLKWGRQNEFETFNFGGAGHPDKPYGVREFKRKFGGQLVEYGYFSHPFKPILYDVLKKLHHVMKQSLKLIRR